MLMTDDFWEDADGTAVARKLAGYPGLRQFWCIEVPVNLQLFHLDLRSRSNGEVEWSRYIFDNIRRIIPILSGQTPGDARLSLQTRRVDRAGYSILIVKKILVGTIVAGFDNYAFVCGDGEKYHESGADLSIGEFKNERVVWTSRP